MDIRDEIIKSSLNTAKAWRAKNNANWASRSYTTAIMAMLSKSLTSCDNSEGGIKMFSASGGGQCLQELHRTNMDLQSDILAGKFPWSVVGGNYHLIVFSHVALLVGELQISEEFLCMANQREIAQLGTNFWRAYAHALFCASKKESFDPPQLKLRRGLERYWVKYINLISHIAAGDEVSEDIREIDDSFAERNKDTRIKDDQYEIEGSARQPVLWDFRKEAILKIKLWK